MKEQYVYIMLVRTNTVLSRLIHFFTGDAYTHSAIGVDDCEGAFYGFGRRWKYWPFLGCFHKEYPWMFKHVVPCRIYRISVSSESYNSLVKLLDDMYEDRDSYHYNFAGVVALWLGMSKPSRRDHHFFCSQFVIWALEQTGCVTEEFKPEEFRPSSFCTLPCAKLIYEGVPSRSRVICRGISATAYK